uniref:Glutaredoxin-dependent peroxiredoxin n=1 Tax=Mantoniella antarctica TaxID=81844 RepID=A0A7S0X5E6_9CHLO|mmetsp:Transcript_24204/g.38951  ORF Transcript_24204/g.38951 Transcript_24204/m.38951 type:complete len:221 (-) Transcript_24204:496-1158(-)
MSTLAASTHLSARVSPVVGSRAALRKACCSRTARRPRSPTSPSSSNKGAAAAAAAVTSATAKVGDTIPEATLQHFDSDGTLQTVSTTELCAGKKVVLFAVPGAFTPTCSLKHVPGFIKHADELLDRGVDVIACVSVNDAFVMNAWAKTVEHNNGRVTMLADGSCLFTQAMGAELDLNEKGLGVRSRRYAMIVEDGVITHLSMEEGGELNISSAEAILRVL